MKSVITEPSNESVSPDCSSIRQFVNSVRFKDFQGQLKLRASGIPEKKGTSYQSQRALEDVIISKKYIRLS